MAEGTPIILTPDQRHVLQATRIGHLATADAEGQPYLVPCCFTVVEDQIVTAIDEKPKQVAGGDLRRVRNIRANPRVSLVVDHYEEDWSKIGYLLILGRAEIVDRGSDRPEAIAALRAKYRQYGAMALDDQPLIVITPTRVTGWGIYRG